jgi:hypothetical protein
MLSALARRCSSYAACGLAAVLVTLSAPNLTFAQQPATPPGPGPGAADAKASLADAEKAVKAKDWASAAKFYDAANKTAPSADALEGLANAYYNGGQLGESWSAYNEWNDKYSAKAPAPKKATNQARLKELDGKTGFIAVTVNEPGALIFIDDKQVGVSPLPGPIRLTSGVHKLKVTKDGFGLYDQQPNVAAGTTTTSQVTLASAASKGKIVVKEKNNKPVRVILDGVDMGEAPWTGEVDPGQHEIAARGAGLAAIPQKINVERGKTSDVEIEASSSTTPVKITTTDGKGLIFLDGKLVGEGSFTGDIPSGPHKLRITREGFDPFEEDITLKDKDPYSRSITLSLSGKISTGPMQVTERLEGLYGGFNFLAMFTPGGTGSALEQLCEAKDKTPALVSCDAPDGFGGGFGGFLGYHWDPVGIELFLSAQYDQRTVKTDWNAQNTDPGIGPDPARLEEYNLRRLGGMGMARVRVTKQWPKLRISMAIGAGLVRRVLFLDRDTRSKDDPNLPKDVYVSDSAGYWSFIVGAEPSIMYRLTPGVAVSAGAQIFMDGVNSAISGNDGENPRSTKDAPHAIGGRGLTTNALDLSSNVQVFVGPFIGMMFGP